jgi:hypothetical protein
MNGIPLPFLKRAFVVASAAIARSHAKLSFKPCALKNDVGDPEARLALSQGEKKYGSLWHQLNLAIAL